MDRIEGVHGCLRIIQGVHKVWTQLRVSIKSGHIGKNIRHFLLIFICIQITSSICFIYLHIFYLCPDFIILRHLFHWVQHVICMLHKHLAKIILLGQLDIGNRMNGGQECFSITT